LRIIGGAYRGRKLPVPSQPGLRPTSDRVRETLFNWLSPVIEGARCLDLFAGSGALGIEAASRGAGRVVLVERSEPVARVLRENVRTLGATQVSIVRDDARRWLAGRGEPYDLVFLDPPFGADLLAPCCGFLAANDWLAPGALVYLEAAVSNGFPELPEGWRLIRDRRAGQVRFGLVEIDGELGGL
jgi:16S rRNA (guanine966-N2)-methyltransferase